jgi:hypothetical protein
VPFTAEARWKEFYPGDGPAGEQWRKRPHNQLSVRAESHALRKAFPYQTSRLEAIEAAPQAWIEAAETDEAARRSPERQKALAAEHDRIHMSDEEWDRSADPTAEPAKPEPEDDREARLQTLIQMAKTRGLKPATGQEFDDIDAEIEHWDKRIEQHDLDQLAAKQSKSAR